MVEQPKLLVLALSALLVIPPISALGQIGRGAGDPGERPAVGGTWPSSGLSRRGQGTASNPIVNPAPSLTPNQLLNPRGSLSSGQVLNPSPSLRRPRSDGLTTATQQKGPKTRQGVVVTGSASPRARPTTDYSCASHFAELGTELGRYKNGESWAKYLALPTELRGEEITEGAIEQAERLLKRFDKLSSEPSYAKVTALPAFWLAQESLKLKIDPTPTPTTGNQPSVGDPALSRRTVGERILQSVVALDAKIAKEAPAEGLQKRLSLDELRVAVPVLSEQPTDDAARTSLDAMLKTYQTIATNQQDSVVNQMPEFKETLAALQEYLSPLDTRPQKDLSRSFDQLGDQLREFRNGESWANYLALPSGPLRDERTQTLSEPTTKLLKRFDKLNNDATYVKVSALVAFRPAYEALKLAANQDPLSPPSSTLPDVNGQPVTPTAQESAAANQPATVADRKPIASENQKPLAAMDKNQVVDTQPIAAADPSPPPVTHHSVGERILKSVLALEDQLANVAPDNAWAKRLSLDELEATISMTSDQVSSDSDRKSLQGILQTYQSIANNKDDAVVNQLPEFQATLQALKEYLRPR